MVKFMVGGDNYLLWMIPGILLTLFANFRLRRKFKKYNKVQNAAKLSGKETSRLMLDSEDLKKIPIKQVAGKLTDYYDPRSKTVNLSQPVYGKETIAAMSVAAHETGHAIQDKDGYFFMRLRKWIAPLATLGTNLGYILIAVGLIINATNLARIGVFLFALTTLFALVTMPVEFNASDRAKKKLKELGLTKSEEEDHGADEMLDAARFTYVAAFAISGIQLLYWSLAVRDDRHQLEAKEEAKETAMTTRATTAPTTGEQGAFMAKKSVSTVDNDQTPGTMKTIGKVATAASASPNVHTKTVVKTGSSASGPKVRKKTDSSTPSSSDAPTYDERRAP